MPTGLLFVWLYRRLRSLLLAAVIFLVVLRFRNSSAWVDGLLLLGLAVVGALLEVVLTR